MGDLAGWIALGATCLAALMTASNLGPRMTGWGFVIFTFGAIAWIVVGVATGQTQLLWSNIFLGVVDLFGIWRWLGWQTRISDTVEAEQDRSETESGETLFAFSKLGGMVVIGSDGSTVAHAVDALAACSSGRFSHLIIAEGGVAGVGETLRKLPWNEVKMAGDTLVTDLDCAHIQRLERAEAA
ncbi:MAG: PRC-barrel domain-containing protein [Sphingopyxis sp.]|nr:PRC-barrel domain-containing protein [Sphingopyxis sp.]